MITQKQIAQRLNLSQSTVANILRGAKSRYRAATREAVLSEARLLGYRPNRSAQSIQRGRSNLIGIIHFGARLEVSRKVAAILPRCVNERGYDYLVIDLNWHGGNVERVLNEIIQARVEGVIITHMVETFIPAYTAQLTKAGIPVVSLFGNDHLNVPVVKPDIASAFYGMTRHLLNVGHRRILHIGGGSNEWPVERRLHGFRRAMEEAGTCDILEEKTFLAAWRTACRLSVDEPCGMALRIDNDHHGHDFLTANYEICQRLFRENLIPDAIVCSNDQGAFGVFNAAYEYDLRVPRDLAVTGSDDDRFGSLPMFKLSTIGIDLPGACESVVELLFAQMQGTRRKKRDIFCATRLILRSSCGRSISMESLSVSASHSPKN